MAIAIKILLLIAVVYTNVNKIQADPISDVVDEIMEMFVGKNDEQRTSHRNNAFPSFEQLNKCLIHLVSPNLANTLRSCDFLGVLGQSSQASAGQPAQKFDQGQRQDNRPQFPFPNYGFNANPFQAPVWPPQYPGVQAGQQQIPTYQQPPPVQQVIAAQQPQPVPAAQPQPLMQPPLSPQQPPAASLAPPAAPQALPPQQG